MLLRDELFLMRKKYEAKQPRDLRLPQMPNPQDPLAQVWSDREKLLCGGTIRFAHIVQANTILFDSYPAQDSAACVVYSTDSYIEEYPETLKSIAQLLYRYRTMPIEFVPLAHRDLAAALKDEYDRSVHRITLLCGEKMVEFVVAPIWIFRHLLPKRKLCGGFLPVLTHEECNSLLTVPKEYWPFEFLYRWRSGRL